jgi:hypothetical protein
MFSPLTSSDVTVLQQLQAWVRDVISAPYPGEGFVRPGGPVCPYTQDALDDGTLLLAVEPDVDGTDLDALDAVLHEALDWFIANVDRDQFLHSLVVGFPAVTPTSTVLDEAVDRLRDKRMAHSIIAAGMFQDNDLPPEQLVYPDGIAVPVPAFVVRYLSPFDNRFLDREPHILDAFLARFSAEAAAGTLPPAARRQISVACEKFGRESPLPPAQR